MSRTSPHHHELTNGVGKCSVPMWMHGCPAGFCDRDAYGNRPEGKQWRDARTGELKRFDCKYNGYIPGLACAAHGGPTKEEPALGRALGEETQATGQTMISLTRR